MWLWVWCRLATSSAGSSPVRHKPSRSWKGTLRGDIPAEAAIVWAWRSGHLCKFLSVFGFLPGYNSARAIRCGAAGGRLVVHTSRIQHVREPCMDAPATGTKSGNPQSVQHAVQHEDRNTWIFTGYAICGIVAFGVLAYYAALYFAS